MDMTEDQMNRQGWSHFKPGYVLVYNGPTTPSLIHGKEYVVRESKFQQNHGKRDWYCIDDEMGNGNIINNPEFRSDFTFVSCDPKDLKDAKNMILEALGFKNTEEAQEFINKFGAA